MAAAGGVGVGLVYLLLLWRSAQRLTVSRHPVLGEMFGFVLRMAVVLAGLYLIGNGQWERVISGLVGFVLIRSLVLHWLGPSAERRRARRERQVS